MVVAEVHAYGRAGGGDDLLEFQRVSVSPEHRDAARSVVDGRHQSAVVLFDSSRVASDATCAMRRQRLEQRMALRVVDLDLVRTLVVGHRDDERAAMAARVN